MSVAPRSIAGRNVTPIGFGPMRCSYEPLPDLAQAIRTIHAALDAGANLIDTADCYAPSHVDMHHNEVLIAKALAEWSGERDSILIATKVGHVRTERAIWERCGQPKHLRAACERSLQALGVERIALLQLHSVDPSVAFEDQIGTLDRLRAEGKVESIGLCNVGRKQLAVARALTHVASVQNRYSLLRRDSEAVLRQCEIDRIPFLAWSPLDASDTRQSTLRSVARIAELRRVSRQQVALGWLLLRSPAMIPLVGATRPETARDSLGAAQLSLDPAEIDEIDAEVATQGKLSKSE